MGHEVTGYVIAFGFATVLAICGYLLDALRMPEDRAALWLSSGALLIGGIGMGLCLLKLVLIGLAL